MITKFSILLLFYLCSYSLALESIIPQKSPNDSNQYQALVLQNQLKILFINDKLTEKSSCAILVGVGSAYNPQNAPGLAHFLQHMLFMGSKKFPSETQFSNFIQINSGSRNAQTSLLHTVFYFQVKNSAFGEGVQRLVDFFVSPLIKQSGLQRERLAVNNQFSLGLGQDPNRKSQILKSLASPPYSYFTTGNNQTLNYPTVREDLVKFYNEYYSSNIMTAVVYSNESINTMKQKYIPIFSEISNKRAKKRQFSEDFKKQNLGKLIRVQSVKDDKTMDIYWIVQNLLPYYKAHLFQYIQYVANSQVPGSLRSILIDNGYVASFNSGAANFVGQSGFYVSVRFTELGLNKYDLVYNIIINYMKSIKFQRYIYDQIRFRNQLSFKFAEKSSSTTGSIRNIAVLMNKIPVQQVLRANSIFEDFDNAQKIANRILGQISSQNVIAMLLSKTSLNNSKQQKYYKGKYSVQSLPAFIQTEYLYASPKPNPFLPIDTRLIQFQQKTRGMKKLGENIYFMQDNSFKVPKGGIQLRVFGAENIQFLNFYASYLELALRQDLDPAQMLFTSVSFDGVNCLVIKIFGFRDTCIKILQKVIQRIFVVQYGPKSKQSFNNVLKGLLDSYSNYYKKPSIDIANSILTTILTKGFKTQQEGAEEYKSYEYYQILNRINRFWVKTFARWVFVGNFYQEDIKWLTRKIQFQINGYRKGEVPSYAMLKLNKNIVHEVILENNQTTTSCGLVYYQIGRYSQKYYYQLLLLKSMIDQPYFDKLRTQKQLAYRLGVIIQNLRNILGLRFYLVSSTNDPKNISEEIKQFTNNFYGQMIKYLTQNKEQKFTKLKESLKITLHQQAKSMNQLFSFIIDEVRLKTYVYNRKDPQYINNIIQSIKAADLKQMWDNMKQYTADIYIVAPKHKQKYMKYNVNSMKINQIKNTGDYYEDRLRQT